MQKAIPVNPEKKNPEKSVIQIGLSIPFCSKFSPLSKTLRPCFSATSGVEYTPHWHLKD